MAKSAFSGGGVGEEGMCQRTPAEGPEICFFLVVFHNLRADVIFSLTVRTVIHVAVSSYNGKKLVMSASM